MRALGYAKAGANPQLQLCFIEVPIADPEWYLIWDCVAQFRKQMCEPLMDMMLRQASEVPHSLRKPGPIGVLVSRLSMIGWQHVRGSSFMDSEGCIADLCESFLPELKWRLKRCFQFMVGMKWSSGKDYEGLVGVSAALSRPSKRHPGDDMGFVRSVQNGIVFTGDFQAHMTIPCKLCEAPADSMQHRHWECPGTASSCAQIDQDVTQFLVQQPKCTTCRGWFCEPSDSKKFRQSLMNIPNDAETFEGVALEGRSVLHLFVDGTAIDPAEPLSRLTAWSVVLASRSFPVEECQGNGRLS